jgi:hypothetical protein
MKKKRPSAHNGLPWTATPPLKGRKTMTLLIVLAFPEIVVFIAIVGIYSKQIICGTEEWD